MIYTFPAPVELDHDFLVHVFVQIEDVLPFRFLLLMGGTMSPAATAAAAASAPSGLTTPAGPSPTTAELTSFRHSLS